MSNAAAATPIMARLVPIVFLLALMLLGTAAVMTSGTLWQDGPGHAHMLIGRNG